ncbi:MAG: PaaI family thioesterase [Nocardioides sp.]
MTTREVPDASAVLDNGLGALNDKLGIELVEASATRLVATMPVEGNTQPMGLLHGGASMVLAEALGSVGAAMGAYPDRVAVGVDINGTHHRAVRSGVVTGIATPLHQGRRISTWQVDITDSEDRRVCTARITCALVPRGD